jgi:hypothetical protein
MDKQSGGHSDLFSSTHVAPYAEYFLAYAGGIWGCFGVRTAQILGALGVASGIGLTATVARKKKRQYADVFAVCQVAWFLGDALVTSAARSQLGVLQALESRYKRSRLFFGLRYLSGFRLEFLARLNGLHQRRRRCCWRRLF